MKLKNIVRAIEMKTIGKIAPEKYKEYYELKFWKGRQKQEEGTLSNEHYEYFYTELFQLDHDWYQGKRILDVGCGPRGSLEWADMSTERVGLDPLAKEYLKLGADKHKMDYVDSPSEKIPFPDGHFDVLCTFNSLDHVADYDTTISEFKRVTKVGGSLLLIVEVNHEPTPTEPVFLGWDFLKDFKDTFVVNGEIKKYEIGDHRIYRQIKGDAYYDESNSTNRPGILIARLDRIK